jgi:hypothetical protein
MHSKLRNAALAVLASSLLASGLPLSAQAKAKANGLTPALGLENWKYGLDLSGYKSGKYNLIVEGKDKAGNVTRAAPMNIYVDPKSDLPIASIINPYPLMRVGGDLNIVGTCVDDDAVARVEVSLDGGEYVPAEGGEFWSLYLKTANVSEGRRTLDVRGVDVNGLVGPSVRVQFDLDRTKPLASVGVPEVGSLVSGQIRLVGTVFDANGVRSLEISQDGGKAWAKVDLKVGKDKLRPSFSWPVDTRKLGDGPKVFSLRSVDMVGSTSTAAYLLFVDNTKPVVEVLRPATGASVNGRFTLVGAVRDVVGVKRLGYEFGSGEKGEIPLTKGDPYFAKELDSYSVKGDAAVVTLIAEDTIGNVTRYSKTYKIDRKADKPVLKVSGPVAPAPDGKSAQAATLRSGEPIWGSVADDDGVAAFRWSLDGGAPAEVPCSESFSLILPAAASGKHSLSLVPVDVNGLAGDATIFPFSLDKGPGAIVFDRITSPKAQRDFAQGARTSVDSLEFLEGSVAAPNPPVSADVSIAGAPAKSLLLAKGTDGSSWRFRIALDRSLPYGFAPIALRVKDAAGNSYEGRALVYATDYGVAREETGFRFSDTRIGSGGKLAFGRASQDGEVQILLGAFYGGPLKALRLDPPTDLVAASYEGRTVIVKAVKDGISPPTRLVGTTEKGHEFSSDPFVFATDSSGPELKVSGPAQGTWFKASLEIAGTASDAGGKVSLAWRRLPDGQSLGVDLKGDGSFAIPLSAPELPAGSFSVELTAADESGNATRAYLSLGADAAPPVVRFLSPEAGATVSGAEDVAAMIDDSSGVASVEYAADGKTFAAIDWTGRYFVHRADLAANPQAAYRVTDRAGNAAVARPEVSLVPAPERVPASASISVSPNAGEAKIELSGSAGALKPSILLPGLSEADYAALGDLAVAAPERFATRLLVQGALSLKGQATVDAQVKAISLSVDGGATYRPLASNKDAKSAKAVLAFAFAIEAAKLQDGPARWTIKVEDFSGASFFCPVYALVDLKAPSLSALYPEKGALVMSGPFPLVLKAEDGNGLASGEIASGAGAAATKEALGVEAGGRYFARMIDPSSPALKGAPLSLALSAKDAAGNAASLPLKYGYDAAADSPKIVLALPAADAKGVVAPLEADALVCGSASDDDGVPGLRVSVDGGEAMAFPAGSFALALNALPVGKHSLVIEAGDAGSGHSKLARDFTVKGSGPALGDFKIGDAKASSAWSPGADYELKSESLVQGSAWAPNGLASLTVAVNGAAPVAAVLGKAASAGGKIPFSAALPASLPYDRVVIEIAAKDALGLGSLARLEFHKILPPLAGTDDEEGIRFADGRIREAEGGKSFLLSPGERLRGLFNGRHIKAVSLSPASPCLTAGFDGSSVTIDAAAEGLVVSSTLSVETIDGDIFSWGPFSAAVDSGPPALELDSPSDHDWVRGEVQLKGKAADPQGIALLQASVNGGDPVDLLGPDGKAPPEAAFDKVVSLATAPDGSTRIDLLARDAAGRESRLTRFINKDTLPPDLTQVEPIIGESVNGLTTFVGEAADGGRLASAAFLSAAGAEAEDVSGLGSFSRDLDLARLTLPLADGGGFVVADKAGNKALLVPTVVVDKEKDKPVVEIHAPTELEVMRGDFAISGVAYDDDGLAAAYYRLDGGEWTRLPMQGTSFSVPVALKDTTDNEHLVEVKAEDIYGVQGDVASRKYRVSKEEPVALMIGPSIAKPVRGTVKLVGTAADANGIKDVSVSVDNRTSYDSPVGAEAWGIGLDTTTLADGIHAVAVRPVDGYETEGFYASMVSIDNTAPKAQMDLPRDGDEVAGSLAVSGRVSDNLAIASSRIEIAPVGSDAPPALVLDLGSEKIVQRVIDLAALKSGSYTVRLVVVDRADNQALASRDIVVVGAAPADSISVVFPVEGERPSGRLRVQGRARVASGPGPATVLLDGADIGAAECDELGWFSIDIPAESLADGPHTLKARTSSSDGRSIESPETRIEWRALGPWVSIESIPSGRYLPYRPFLNGKAGWAAEAAPDASDKKALEAYRREAKSRAVSSVELSLDDGRSFLPAKGGSSWSFRLETQDYKEGALHVIVRAHYAGGASSTVKALYFLDKTLPEVEVLTPSEGGRFNGVLALSGRAADLNGLDSVGVALRKGDKASYEVPSFIQGLYLDGQMLGATDWQAGLGLTFLGDNIKIQGNYGKLTSSDQTFFGDVFGAKLIANILYLPFVSLFGPDWSFLSASLGVGAQFSYFSQTQAGSGLTIGAILGQVEFPKITLSGMGAFNKFSLYGEFQLWVFSSVVEGGFRPKASVGARIGVF